MLLLFDIDGTLVDTGGAGLVALQEAVREVFQAECPPLDLAGATDGGLLRFLFEYYGHDYDEGLVGDFYEAYLPKLERNLGDEVYAGKVLPGVGELLRSLEGEDCCVGLLTGNLARGAWIKVGHFGLAGHFAMGAFGDDHWDRNELGPIARTRAEEKMGRTFLPQETLVIGDTPKDVACARAFGARSLAVATGGFTQEQLVASGADEVLDTLVGLEGKDLLKGLRSRKTSGT